MRLLTLWSPRRRTAGGEGRARELIEAIELDLARGTGSSEGTRQLSNVPRCSAPTSKTARRSGSAASGSTCPTISLRINAQRRVLATIGLAGGRQRHSSVAEYVALSKKRRRMTPTISLRRALAD